MILDNQSLHDLPMWNIFQKLKFPEENLGVGLIRKNDLHFESNHSIHYVEKYFEKGIFLDYKSTNDLNTAEATHQYKNFIEPYAKAVWLTNEFLAQGFRNPIGIHFEPNRNDIYSSGSSKRIVEGKWRIHPGGTRQQIIQHFYKDEYIRVIAFNTWGKEFQFEEIFETKRELGDYLACEFLPIFVPDHGTLIPHILTEVNSIDTNVLNTHSAIKEEIRQSIIFINDEFNFFKNHNHVGKKIKKININIKNPGATNLTKAYFALLQNSYIDDDIEIEKTDVT